MEVSVFWFLKERGGGGLGGGRGKALFLPNGGSLFGKLSRVYVSNFAANVTMSSCHCFASPTTIDDLPIVRYLPHRYHILFPSELLAAAIYSSICTLLLVGV